MASRSETLASALTARFGERLTALPALPGEVAVEVRAAELVAVCRELRDAQELKFEQLIDLSGVDYVDFGKEEWKTYGSTSTGFSRGVSRARTVVDEPRSARFAVSYQLLSVTHNWRLRLRSFAVDGEPPLIDSVTDIWASANWYEREAFDLYGIMFQGHPDLRRILTDYGFVGHPFRKDFPLSGNVEVRYDPEKKRVVYEPVVIDRRVLVPRVIRQDARYVPAFKDLPKDA